MPTLYVLRGPDKGRTFQTPNVPVIMGRQSDHIPLTDNAASREHAVLKPDGDHWVITDLNSSNGTYVNGQHIREPTPLKHGDQIKIGSTLLVFGGDDSIERFSRPMLPHDLVEYAETGTSERGMDSSILSAIPSCEESVILATPETADAVQAWKLMYQIAEAIGTFGNVDAFLERITDLICHHFVFDHALVLMVDPDSNDLVPQVVRCRSDKGKDKPKIIASRTIINHVRETRHGILCANAMTDQRFTDGDNGGSIHGLGLRSVLCVPIIAHDQVQGVLHIACSMAQHTYNQEQLRLATAVGRMAGLAIENARLEQARMKNERLAAMGETVAYLSHHIRNILQGLHSGSDVLELGIRRKNLDTVMSAWKIIQRNLDRILHLVTNMLTFSKDRQPAMETDQLNKVIGDVVSLTQRSADDKGVMLLTDLADIPPFPLDKEGIHQAVLNLVLNAIDAAPESDGRVVVTTHVDSDNSTVVILVRDNGPGIRQEHLPHLFEPFCSTKGHGGTGLGLAAAYKVICESGGKLKVDTRLGEGTTFKVMIPMKPHQVLDSDTTIGSVFVNNPG
ncbi:MAG: FHA domain-containing protein [Phycisphaerae bacterium]|nr:FHA domain-containing protein [Phycisphaerae bacterium]